jgi:arylsulfatase
MASNTPLRRYKQNTHGGGIRDPFVISWPKRVPAKG